MLSQMVFYLVGFASLVLYGRRGYHYFEEFVGLPTLLIILLLLPSIGSLVGMSMTFPLTGGDRGTDRIRAAMWLMTLPLAAPPLPWSLPCRLCAPGGPRIRCLLASMSWFIRWASFVCKPPPLQRRLLPRQARHDDHAGPPHDDFVPWFPGLASTTHLASSLATAYATPVHLPTRGSVHLIATSSVAFVHCSPRRRGHQGSPWLDVDPAGIFAHTCARLHARGAAWPRLRGGQPSCR